MFQIQSGKGGTNPALRTFYYRLLRLLSLNIHPLFVFDGPNKPLFKRNKRVGGGGNVKVSSVPEFLAKQLLKQFGFPLHLAPGEAEAECALLQREGIVDAVLSEDVDTLMFGSRFTMRNWSPEAKSSKVPTHVNVYDAQAIKADRRIDREGMILVALMSGGDYIPEGIPGCGPKTACEAAKAGFGADLCRLRKRDNDGFSQWRERLRHELWTNESKLFRTRRRIEIPDDFPNREVLGYYTDPCVSGPDKITQLRQTLRWDMPMDFPSLRSFTADAFDWAYLSGAKKFIRNLAPAILTRELRLRAEQGANDGGNLELQASAESRLVVAIHGKREHVSTDQTPEIRISFLPLSIVSIDLSIEEPDPDVAVPVSEDSASESAVTEDTDAGASIETSPRKRGPSKYDPSDLEKIWLPDTYLRLGVPLMVQDWEASTKNAKAHLAAKHAARAATQAAKLNKGMRKGALDPYAQVMKPGVVRSESQPTCQGNGLDVLDLSQAENIMSNFRSLDRDRGAEPVQMKISGNRALMSSKAAQETAVPKSAKKAGAVKRPSPSTHSPRPRQRTMSETPKTSRMRQTNIVDLLTPKTPAQVPPPRTEEADTVVRRLDFRAETILDLPDTVTRRKRSPFRRVETAPAVMGDRDGLDYLVPDLGLEFMDLSAGQAADYFADPTPVKPKSPTRSPTGASRQKAVEIVDLMDSPVSARPAPLPEQPVEPTLAAVANRTSIVTLKAQGFKKSHYQVRESLEGAWKEVLVDVDLTSPTRGVSTTSFARETASMNASIDGTKHSETGKNNDKRRWRYSEVDILDLTAT